MLSAPAYLGFQSQANLSICGDMIARGTKRTSKLMREMASALCLLDPKVLIMLSVYCNDSGMLGGPHCFLGGYLASVDRWAEFCEAWQRLCDEYLEGKPLRIVVGNPLSDDVLVEFAHCIIKHVETEIWTAAPEFYLAKFAQKHGVRFDKYRLCFHGLLEEMVLNCHVQQTSDQLAWFFGDPEKAGDDPTTELKLSLMRGFADARSLLSPIDKPLLHSISFADYEATPPLQAAHFLVEHKRRYHSTPVDAPVDPAYLILRTKKLRRAELVWFDHTLEDSLTRLLRTDALK
jgi:hypothetical protein